MPKYKRGSGSVYKRGKTYWIAYYGPDGKQVCESARTTDKAEARRVLQARLGQLAEGRFVGPTADRVTFEELAEGLLTDYQVNGKKSLRSVRIRVDKHLLPYFGKKTAHKITTPTVQAYIHHRQEGGASNAEINRELAALKRAFNLAIRAEKITRKPYIQKLEENNVRQGFFEPWQFDALLAALPEYLRPPMTFAYYTGWRVQSEILSLTWAQVDLEAGTVRLYRGTTKNKDGRLIKLPQVLSHILERQWHAHVSAYPDCPLVFHRSGQRIKDIRGTWDRACQDIGLPGRIPHDFRRTAVRNLVRAGVPERVAMMITGHKTRDIFDRYNIVSEGDLEEAARQVDARIARRTTTVLTTTTLQEEQQNPLSH